MLDLDALQQKRDEACVDKSDLFDFYNRNWDALVGEIERLRGNHDEFIKTLGGFIRTLLARTNGIDLSLLKELDDKFGELK